MSDQLLEQAFEAKGAGDYELARRLYQDCLSVDPRNAEALRELGMLTYGIFKDDVTARELVERSLEIEDCAMGHFYLGLILDSQDLFPLAEKEFEHSLKESGGDAMMHTMYGDILGAQGKFDQAKEHFVAALAKEADYEPAQKSYAKLMEVLEQSNEIEDDTPSM